MKPTGTDAPAYYLPYINRVPENDLGLAFRNQANFLDAFWKEVTDEHSAFAYAAGKWTIREVMQHIIDTERIFAYRALSFARGEKQSLPGYEEDEYAQHSGANARHWQELVDEFKAVRLATTALYNSFTKKTLAATGIANDNPMSVIAIGFMIVGHCYHHVQVIRERYLSVQDK